jgi:lipoprotein-releasing system permease protein
MFGTFERMLAFRYLRARRKEGFISVIAGFSLTGIALGVATLIIVMAVMNGFRKELLGRIIGINGHASLYGQTRFLDDYETLAQSVAKLPGVSAVTPVVEGQVMVSANGVAQGAMVNGMDMEGLKAKPMLMEKIVAGSLENYGKGEGEGEGIVLGARLAQKMGVGVGDVVTLISPEGRATVAGMVPRLKDYRIVALFNIGMFEYDSGLIFMPLKEAQTYFRYNDRSPLYPEGRNAVSHLEIRANDVKESDAMVAALREQFSARYRVLGWQDMHASFFNAIQVERNVMFLILTLIILVAAFNIISSLIMLVRDKGKDIAILRTMGASRGMILRVFFMCGASIGVVGTLLGVALGLGFALNIETIRQWLQGLTGKELFSAEIYFLSTLPAEVDMREVLQVVLMALGLSFLATIFPARRAAKLDPAEALRYE